MEYIRLSLILLGCETTVISANPRQVIVKSSELDAKESQRLAEAECGKHQRYARMSLKATNIDPNYVRLRRIAKQPTGSTMEMI